MGGETEIRLKQCGVPGAWLWQWTLLVDGRARASGEAAERDTAVSEAAEAREAFEARRKT